MLHIPRHEALLLCGLLLTLGLAWVVARLFRTRKHGISIRMQIFIALATTILVANAVFSWIVVDRFRARTALFAHSAALDDARVLSELSTRSIESLGLTLEQGAMLLRSSHAQFGFTRGERDTRVQLLDANGRMLFDSFSATSSEAPPDPTWSEAPEVRAALRGEIDRVARIQKNGAISAAVPIYAHARVIGAARVLKSALSGRDVLTDLAPKVLLLALMLTFASAGAGAIIGRSLAAPLERLTLAAENIARGARQTALPSPRGREVRRLTGAFEAMRTALEQRSFVETFAADLSHELKNPVASIQAAAEVLEDAAHCDPESAARFARHIGDAARRLDKLIRDILALAGLEARGVASSRAAVRMRPLVESICERAALKAEAKRVALKVDAPADVSVVADETWLDRAIANLLDNAISFAPPRTTVSLTVARVKGASDVVDIIVCDAGPGFDANIRGDAFQRFVTTRHDEGGTGLGLAIVRAVAEAHGGSVSVRSTGPAGSTVALSIPVR